MTLSCRGYVKSLKHDPKSLLLCNLNIQINSTTGEIEYLDNLNSSKCDRQNHFSSFFHLITGGLVRDVPLCLSHLILVIPLDTGNLSSVATATSYSSAIALQISIIAQICSSSFDLSEPYFSYTFFKCMSRLLLSTSYSRVLTRSPLTIHGIG